MTDSITLWGITTTPLELLSFLLSVIAITLTILEKHWAWLFTIVSSALYALVFINAKLYGDSALQGMFIVIAIFGWYQWLCGGKLHQPVQISELTFKGRMRSISFWLVAYLALAELLWRFTDTDVPRVDGALTAGSILGQYLVSKKKIENWIVWIVVDIAYVALYVYKDLKLTAFLYAIFVVLAIIGLRTWRKQVKTNLPSSLRQQ